MHVKYLHVLCSLLDHITTYFIKDMDMYFIDSTDFLNNLLYFDFNSTE
jgi:hypothetical protein